jgi:2-polyprenyl-3-methyl-5-hydroxy-6-metoxy-1,4-benzoquinol methylase
MQAITKTVSCNICNSDDYTVMFPSGKAQIHNIVKCNVCNLIYANPQTDNVGGVEDVYLKFSKGTTDADFEEALKDFTPEKNQYMRKQFLQLKDYNKIIDFVDKPGKGIFLEIGSFAGIFLNEAKKKGWQVLGIEPLLLPAYYSEKLGVKVMRTYFDKDTDIADESIDVIVATHVIEHVSDPSEFVSKAHQVLTKGGKLILETPTYDSFVFKLLKHRERSVKCSGHIYFFTKETLSKLVEKAGFKVIKHEKVGRTLTLERLFYNFGVMTGKKQFFANAAKNLKLDKFVVKINARDMQRIYCEKI